MQFESEVLVMRRVLTFALAATLAVIAVSGASGREERVFPERISLPNGFQPEGIATAGQTFYVGSIPTGAIYRGNVRTGRGAVFVQGRSGRAAIGVEVARNLVFVAGGDTGRAFVYNARNGRDVAEYRLTTASTFINDVVVTRDAAWFTDSVNPVLYRVPIARNGRPGPQSAVRTVRYSGDIEYETGFNVNGIDAVPSGRMLVIVQSNTGFLFTVSSTGATRRIGLAEAATVQNGDGLLLDGRTLYVVQNRDNAIAKITLAANLRSGRIVRRITDPDFSVPTTVDEFGNSLYAVNARFGTPATPTTEYWVTRARK
jgi:sugar lactone lactonase YvrE